MARDFEIEDEMLAASGGLDDPACPECKRHGGNHLPSCPIALAPGGYCLSGCRVAFASEPQADAHTAMTGHATGFPLEDVDWPVATEDQVMGRG